MRTLMNWTAPAGKPLTALAAIAALGLSACASLTAPMAPLSQQDLAALSLEERARVIHDEVMALDTHIDIALDFATQTNDIGGFTKNQADLPKMRIGGLDAGFFIVYTPQGPLTEEGYKDAKSIAMTRMAGIERMVAGYPEEIGLARTADEAEAIHASGRLVALVGMENPYPLGPSLDDLPMWVERGVRYVSLTHWGHNQFGDSSNFTAARGEPEGPNGGLTDLGRELVPALNRAGVMVDVSHAAKSSMLQAVALSTAPVIASHSGAKGVADNARNLDDEQLRVLADNGGVAQMVALGSYVRAPTPERIVAVTRVRDAYGIMASADYAKLTKEQQDAFDAEMADINERFVIADVANFVDHIDHAVEVAGIDHVGIASDFDGGGGIAGWKDASETFNVTLEMVKRGYSKEDVAKIWGGNLLRVMRAVEDEAARLAQADAADAAGAAGE